MIITRQDTPNIKKKYTVSVTKFLVTPTVESTIATPNYNFLNIHYLFPLESQVKITDLAFTSDFGARENGPWRENWFIRLIKTNKVQNEMDDCPVLLPFSYCWLVLMVTNIWTKKRQKLSKIGIFVNHACPQMQFLLFLKEIISGRHSFVF